PLNFYAIVTVFFVLFIILTGWDFGPMRTAERRAREEGKVLRDGAMPVVDTEITSIEAKPGVTPRLINMMVPLLAMVLMVPAGILITGWPGLSGAAPDAGFAAKAQALLN